MEWETIAFMLATLAASVFGAVYEHRRQQTHDEQVKDMALQLAIMTDRISRIERYIESEGDDREDS